MPNEQMSTLTAGGVTYEIVDKVARDNAISPLMYGAKADGVTDDATAFSTTIQNAVTNNKKVSIPAGTYKLSTPVFADDSVVSSNNGTYNDKKLIVSKNMTSAPINMELMKSVKINSIVGATDKWLGGSCYDSTRDRVVLVFGDDNNTSIYLAAMSTDYKTVALTTTVTAGTHGNSATYNPVTDKIYIPENTVNGSILVIDPSTLTLDSRITIPDFSYGINGVAYDADNNIYYVRAATSVYVFNNDFSALYKQFTMSAALLAEIIGIESGRVTIQANFVYDGQHYTLWHYANETRVASDSSTMNVDKFALTQFNYQTGEPKVTYTFDSNSGYDELESMYAIGDKLYLLGCIGTYTICVGTFSLSNVIACNNFMHAHYNIGPNTDMNDLIDFGTYICKSNAVAATLTNCPFNTAFRLDVLSEATGAYVFQKFTFLNGRLYTRFYNNYDGVWTEVGEIAYTNTYAEGAVTATSGVDIAVHNNTHVRRQGTIVTAELRLQPYNRSDTTSGDLVIANIANASNGTKIRPDSVVYGTCILYVGSGTYLAEPISVSASGNVTIHVPGSTPITSGFVMANMSWVITN